MTRSMAGLGLLVGLALCVPAAAVEPAAPARRLNPFGRCHRTVTADPAATRAAWAAVLEDQGLAAAAESGALEVVSEWYLFPPGRFGKNVAREAPPVSPLYPYYLPRHMDRGEVRVWATIEPREEGSGILVEAEIRMLSMNWRTGEMDLLYRDSDGTIECRLADLLMARLGEAGVPGEPPTRP